MRSRAAVAVAVVVAAACLVLLFTGSICPAHGEDFGYSTLSGGWTWPAGGPVSDSHESGFTLAGSYRLPITDKLLYGLETSYTWLPLDGASLAAKNPGATYSGGDLGLLSITTENDCLLGSPASTVRPFVNFGLGYFRSFVGDATVTHSTVPANYATGVYEGSFFGFHGGIGVLIKKERFGLRLDANYHHLFAGGPDLELFPVRAGIVFYTKD